MQRMKMPMRLRQWTASATRTVVRCHNNTRHNYGHCYQQAQAQLILAAVSKTTTNSTCVTTSSIATKRSMTNGSSCCWSLSPSIHGVANDTGGTKQRSTRTDNMLFAAAAGCGIIFSVMGFQIGSSSSSCCDAANHRHHSSHGNNNELLRLQVTSAHDDDDDAPGTLRWTILQANRRHNKNAKVVIELLPDQLIVLKRPLPNIDASSVMDLEIVGNGAIVSGNGKYRAMAIVNDHDEDNHHHHNNNNKHKHTTRITIRDLTIHDGLAQGADGKNGGGGSSGMGGGLFLNTASTMVKLSNVVLRNCRAVGGRGGSILPSGADSALILSSSPCAVSALELSEHKDAPPPPQQRQDQQQQQPELVTARTTTDAGPAKAIINVEREAPSAMVSSGDDGSNDRQERVKAKEGVHYDPNRGELVATTISDDSGDGDYSASSLNNVPPAWSHANRGSVVGVDGKGRNGIGAIVFGGGGGFGGFGNAGNGGNAGNSGNGTNESAAGNGGGGGFGLFFGSAKHVTVNNFHNNFHRPHKDDSIGHEVAAVYPSSTTQIASNGTSCGGGSGSGLGGAVCVLQGRLELENVHFINNEALGGENYAGWPRSGQGLGGAIFVADTGAALATTNSLFIKNMASDSMNSVGNNNDLCGRIQYTTQYTTVSGGCP